MHSVMTCSVNQKKKKDLLPKISPFVFASSTPAPFPSSCAATSSDETHVPTIPRQYNGSAVPQISRSAIPGSSQLQGRHLEILQAIANVGTVPTRSLQEPLTNVCDQRTTVMQPKRSTNPQQLNSCKKT